MTVTGPTKGEPHMDLNTLLQILKQGGNVVINNLTVVNVDGYNIHIGDNAPQAQRRLKPATRQYPVYYGPEQIDSWEREYAAREQQARDYDHADARRAAQDAEERANAERRMYEALNMNHRRR